MSLLSVGILSYAIDPMKSILTSCFQKFFWTLSTLDPLKDVGTILAHLVALGQIVNSHHRICLKVFLLRVSIFLVVLSPIDTMTLKHMHR